MKTTEIEKFVIDFTNFVNRSTRLTSVEKVLEFVSAYKRLLSKYCKEETCLISRLRNLKYQEANILLLKNIIKSDKKKLCLSGYAAI